MRKRIDSLRTDYLLRRYLRECIAIGESAANRKALERDLRLCVLQLRSKRDLSPAFRDLVADLLARMASSKSALTALDKTYRRKRMARGLVIAMDYLIERRRGSKEAVALRTVSIAWGGIREKSIQDHVTHWRKKADEMIDQILWSDRLGRALSGIDTGQTRVASRAQLEFLSSVVRSAIVAERHGLRSELLQHIFRSSSR